MRRIAARLVMGAVLVTLPVLALVACDEPPPNPLAAGAGGATGQQGGTGGVFLGSTPDGGVGGRPSPAPLASPAAAFSIETTPARATHARAWVATPCPNGPCVAPNVCVNLDYLFVACVPCGGDDQICCPHTPAAPASACDAGLVCGPNPNYQLTPPLDLVQSVCQRPGAPPAADLGLNHQRLRLVP